MSVATNISGLYGGDPTAVKTGNALELAVASTTRSVQSKPKAAVKQYASYAPAGTATGLLPDIDVLCQYKPLMGLVNNTIASRSKAIMQGTLGLHVRFNGMKNEHYITEAAALQIFHQIPILSVQHGTNMLDTGQQDHMKQMHCFYTTYHSYAAHPQGTLDDLVNHWVNNAKPLVDAANKLVEENDTPEAYFKALMGANKSTFNFAVNLGYPAVKRLHAAIQKRNLVVN